MSVSYLICRIADTIEDNPGLPVGERQAFLLELENTLSDPARGVTRLAEISWPGAESRLMMSGDRVFRELARLPTDERAVIARWVGEMVRGMSASVRPPGSFDEAPFADWSDLHRYCFFVAGTVGHLLTDLFRLHCRGIDADRFRRLDALATEFGLALQLTNVTRDLADDKRDGRNFVPAQVWRQAELSPADLFSPAHAAASWQVGAALSADASRYLRDALAYCCALPRSALRVRFFCYTSLIFAARTLRLIDERRDQYARGDRIKMSRGEVRFLLATTLLCLPSNVMLRWLFRRVAHEPVAA